MLKVFLSEEQKKLGDEVRDFVKSIPRELIIDMDADKIQFPKEFLMEAGKRNLLGLRHSPKYGGRGLKWVDEFVALEEISTLGISLACLYSVVSIVGEALDKFGSEMQKEKYLKPTLEGNMYCAEALTEPRGGSDFFGATTRARKEGDYYILNGQKRFIVGGEGADYFLVYAVTNPGAGRDALSAFIVERDMGVKVKHVYGLMGGRGGGAARIVFHDVKVPEENLVGEEGKGSKIFYQMMIPERLPSGATGGSRAILEIAAKYANKRKAFGLSIRNFEAVSFKIAECITKLDAVSALAYNTARVIDEGIGSKGFQRRLVSEVKNLGTEVGWEVVNEAMQIMGGIGYTNVFPIERALRDSRLAMIWTGSHEIMNLIIQHEYYKELLDKKAESRNLEADISLTEEEAEEEKVYE